MHRGGQPVTPLNMRICLRLMLRELGHDEKTFSTHSFRIGQTIDLLKFGLSVETIKKIGCWKSNAVFGYLCSW